GDTYHMELYEWDGPRQVLHYDHETHVFTGVVADSLDSLVYLAALARAKETRQISEQAFDIGLRKLRGKVAPTWHFGIQDHDPEFVPLDAKRRDTEFFFYRSRWIVALLENHELTDVTDIPALFMPDFNQILPEDQLAARFEACEKVIPTALYSMWRAYLFDELELARYLEIGRRHKSRLVRDAAKLVDELREGRNELGTIKDMRARLAAFRALDLDPRRADQRKAEAEAREQADATRRRDVDAELARVSRTAWPELAWRWLDDGIAHRALLEKMADVPELAAQIAMLDELRGLPDDERELVLPRLAGELAPEIEALLVGSLVRNDDLGDVLAVPDDGGDDEQEEGEGEEEEVAEDEDDEPPSEKQIRAALAMTERALRIAPDNDDTQFTRAMLLLDADRAGIDGTLEELLTALPGFTLSNRINIAVRMAKQDHPQFADAVDTVLAAGSIPDDEVADELIVELADGVIERAPEKLEALVPMLPANVNLLSSLAWRAVQAGEREQAIAIYERLLELPIPDEGDERTNYLRALNNACVQAHAGKAYDTAVRIADRAQPVAHENPYIYHSAACAYAAVGNYAKALEQVKLAISHDYDHVGKVEVDTDLGPLLEWPEFKALFRDWHARREGN
ncbi:MAG TPA: hypothetical protein VLB44_08300, partial [Kofleriaceae bacterium]|nr:hypothetical protein [Kofleriaceae bacterium]